MNKKNLDNFDNIYSKIFHIRNPWEKSFKYRLEFSIPVKDGQAFKKFPEHRFFYDKLYIAKSQSLKCGTLDDLIEKENCNNSIVDYPIFIKPRYGHKSGTSKNCYVVKNCDELSKYSDLKEMMWSEYLKENEGMTDFILENGRIVYQISYKYSETLNVFSEEWKYISSENKPPPIVIEWVNKNNRNYTGCLNVQYRGDKIIEVGMRLSRSGMYIMSTNNKDIIESINNLHLTKTWDYNADSKAYFEPFYSFKAWSPIPVYYIPPQYLMDFIMRITGCEFHEYYFEPTGKKGVVFYQFNHKNFEKGMLIKNFLEKMILMMQILILISFIIIIYLIIAGKNKFISKKKIIIFIALIIFLYSTICLNSPIILNTMYKNQKQFR